MTDEIVNKEFTRTFKGYDVDEVEAYIETVIGLYEQLENENKELSMRCDQLSASLQESERRAAEAEENAKQAASESERTVAEAREKAKSIVEGAENSARQLLTEVKLKRDELNRTIEAKHAESASQIESARERAVEEAKELIRSTKLNCDARTRELDAELKAKREECGREIEGRLAECTESIERIKAEHEDEIRALEQKKAEAEAEYNETARIAAEFRERLFAHYSEQIMRLEGFEIPSVPEREEGAEVQIPQEWDSAPVQESSPEPEQVFEPAFEPVQEPTFEPAPEPEAAVPAEEAGGSAPEMTMVFDALSYDRQRSAKKQKKAASFEDTVTMFSVEKEQSGQVHYDSSEISSVKHKLNDIMAKKGGSDSVAEMTVSKKLGFLK